MPPEWWGAHFLILLLLLTRAHLFEHKISNYLFFLPPRPLCFFLFPALLGDRRVWPSTSHLRSERIVGHYWPLSLCRDLNIHIRFSRNRAILVRQTFVKLGFIIIVPRKAKLGFYFG